MLRVCRKRDDTIFSKFLIDDAGLYYNPEMDEAVGVYVNASCEPESERRARKRGGQRGNQNARKEKMNENECEYETNKNECETNIRFEKNENENESSYSYSVSNSVSDFDSKDFDFKGGTGGTPGCVDVEAVDVDVGVGVSSVGVTDSGPPPAKKEIRHKHGEYKRVLLTEAEYNKLVEEFGEAVVSAYIRIVDEYVEGNGNKNGYKNFNLVIRKFIREGWGLREQNKQNQKTLNTGRLRYEHERNAVAANKYAHL